MSMYFEAAANVGKTLDEVSRARGPSRKVIVPDFVGVRGNNIWLLAVRVGVTPRLHAVEQRSGEPVVITQEPAAGDRVRRGSPVQLTVRHQ